MPRVAVLLLNWNGWKDTIECLESVFRLDHSDFRVIVCDNGSQDGSLEKIRAWASGVLAASTNGPPWMQLPAGRVIKPVICAEYTRAQAEAGGDSAVDKPLVIIANDANLGFAGGNNVGLRYALARKEFEFVWLLNNDTVVNESSLSALIERMNADPAIGMCGSTLAYYHHPDRVQALGGASFDFSRGVGQHVGVGELIDEARDASDIESSLDYVVGASILLSRHFLEEVGLMNEDYFLYFEEIDWAARAKGRFKLAWAPESVVFHKEGASIGSSHSSRPSDTSLRYLYRNRLRFAHRYTKKYYWCVWRSICFEALVYIKRRDIRAFKILLNALWVSVLNGVKP